MVYDYSLFIEDIHIVLIRGAIRLIKGDARMKIPVLTIRSKHQSKMSQLRYG